MWCWRWVIWRATPLSRCAQGELTVIGITGSAGKTTTKDLLAAIFTPEGPTVAPVGSYNSEVGVPLTVFRADESTRYLVIEMGADRVGNIEYLANIAHPDHGAILKVGNRARWRVRWRGQY